MYRLYDFPPSGNSYKVRLLLTQLEISFEIVPVNILKKETRTKEFLAKNPNGRIPLLEIEPGQFLAESNAILFYLSQNTEYFPQDSWQQAKVMEWLFFEQFSHEPHLATSRYWITILGKAEEYQAELAKKQKLGYAALEVMEKHLSKNDFFVGNKYTIADISLFAYTHVADEGNFDLSRFPAILAWLERIKSQPKYITI
ncbi:MAG: glutathione S-transferase family protein [Prochloraceae cyanobacterium]|nr:glutathione S-transferase family protein [Prochloraceae cyanobacterium]